MLDVTQVQNTVDHIIKTNLLFEKDDLLSFVFSEGDYNYALDNLSEYFPDATEKELLKLKEFFSMEEINFDPALYRTINDIKIIIDLFNDVFSTNIKLD